MQELSTNHVIIVLGVIAIIAEMVMGVATGFDLFVIGVILVISGALGIMTASFSLSMILIPVLSVLYIFVGRRFIKQRLAITTHATNADALIGKQGEVVRKITKEHPGRVKIDSEVWRAQAQTHIDEGAQVVVQSVSGVTLTVAER
ncbi:MAG: NfeD family protein [Candidatus Levybacteria bacterium]|nr:NfeD family protein [Candidatus Levybacteria bacterium]